MDAVDDAGGAPGFEAWFRDLYPQARGVAYRILGSVPAAEDAAAEAFVRAFAEWPRLSGLEHRDAWVMRVTTNVAIDVARRSPPPPSAALPSTDAHELVVLRSTLVDALASLPRRQREAVVLRHLAGYPAREVATAMGVSDNSVKKHLQRGLARLRAIVPVDEEADLGLA